MEISSAFNAGVQGFQKATGDANKAASNIASNSVINNEPILAVEGTRQQNIQTQTQPSLTQSVVDLKVAEYQAKGSAEIIKTADEALGTLLDVSV